MFFILLAMQILRGPHDSNLPFYGNWVLLHATWKPNWLETPVYSLCTFLLGLLVQQSRFFPKLIMMTFFIFTFISRTLPFPIKSWSQLWIWAKPCNHLRGQNVVEMNAYKMSYLSSTNVLGVTNHFLIGFKAHSMGRNSYLTLLNWPRTQGYKLRGKFTNYYYSVKGTKQ